MPDAFEEVVRLCYAGTRRKFEALVGKTHEAEDLAQDVYVRLLKKNPASAPIQDLCAFVRGIERNVFREFIKKKRRVSLRPLVEGGDTEPAGGEEGFLAMEKQELTGRLRQFLDELDARDRRIVVGSIMFGLSTTELGHSLGMARQTVLSRLSRAVDELRRKARLAGLMT